MGRGGARERVGGGGRVGFFTAVGVFFWCFDCEKIKARCASGEKGGAVLLVVTRISACFWP